MRVRNFLLPILIVVLALTTGIEAKKSRKRDKKAKPLSDVSPTTEEQGAAPSPVQVGASTTPIAPKLDAVVVGPAVAPDIDSPPTKRPKKHERNREGKRNREQEGIHGEGLRMKGKKDRKDKRKGKGDKKNHHKKHNRQDHIETATDVREVTPEFEVEKDTTISGPVNGNPLVEPDVIAEAEPEPTSQREDKHRRNREGRRQRDEGLPPGAEEEEGAGRKDRKKTHKKKGKNEKKKNRQGHQKDSFHSTDETDIEVNPTPSPAVDEMKLTPSGPSPVQTTEQQQTPQVKPESQKHAKKAKKHKSKNSDHELTKTEKRLLRLERKMARMGHRRKNATKIACGDHHDCAAGQCCLLRRSKKVCHVVDKGEGHHCVHDCMCGEGMQCYSRNGQKSLSKGSCRRQEITDTDVESTTATHSEPVHSNELPQ